MKVNVNSFAGSDPVTNLKTKETNYKPLPNLNVDVLYNLNNNLN